MELSPKKIDQVLRLFFPTLVTFEDNRLKDPSGNLQ